MGIKRSLQANEVIYARVSKLGDKGNFYNLGSKVHRFDSLYQTSVRITRKLIVYYTTFAEMEEWIILYYGNFAILGDRVREFAQHTGCSNHMADRTMRSQTFLNELRREHLGWTTTCRQEWRLFLLGCLLHSVASMKKKECQRCSQRSWGEETMEEAPEHPSMRTLLGAMDDAIIQVAKDIYWGE